MRNQWKECLKALMRRIFIKLTHTHRTIASISRHIGMKLQAWTKIALPPGFNIAPSEDPSIASLITQEVVEDEDISLLGGASLALDPAEDYISLLGNGNSLVGNDVHPHEDLYLSDSTTEGHIIASKVKQATSLLTLEFNPNLEKK